MFGVFIFVIFAAVVVALIVWGQKMAAARRAELLALAQKYGWSFAPDDDGSFAPRFEHFGLFSPGRHRKIYNTLRGVLPAKLAPVTVQTGDYRYTTGSGKHQHTHRVSYLLAELPLPGLAGRHLVVRPEHFGDTLGAMIGFDDIDFESEEFSRRFFVKSNDRKFAYAVLDPRMMEFLLAAPCGHLELHGTTVVLRQKTHGAWEVADFEAAFAWLATFLERWPDYLVTELRDPAARRRP